ncbi:MAG TPA: plastocyanin/azurin family copper-binding protein [Gaiellaceae bacterium]|nr:plastocyanin/azurin family copper-binding protein [Gaiellaceae bacterium]
MTRSRAASLILLVLLGLAVAGCGGGDDEESTTTEATLTEGSGAEGGTTLNGSVGPGFEISLDGADGLAPGSYTLVVDDQSSAHNFHLTGPGVDVTTEVGAEGEGSFEVELQAGEYSYVCDPHASQMNGSFTVG